MKLIGNALNWIPKGEIHGSGLGKGKPSVPGLIASAARHMDHPEMACDFKNLFLIPLAFSEAQ